MTSASAWRTRPYQRDDLTAILALFSASIHVLAATHYTHAQRRAWAPGEPDRDAWQARLLGQTTRLGEVDGALAGFIAYTQAGHIDLLYTAPAHARRGIASALYDEAESEARRLGAQRLVAEASLVATPFFERKGFRIVEVQDVVRGGIPFRRHGMWKDLDGPARAA